VVTLTPEKLRAARRIGLNVGFGLLVFIIALYVWFPYARAKDLAVGMAATQDLDVEIGSAGPALFGVTFRDISVSTRPTTGKPTRFLIEAAHVHVSPFAALLSPLLGAPAPSVSREAFGGRVDFQ